MAGGRMSALTAPRLDVLVPLAQILNLREGQGMSGQRIDGVAVVTGGASGIGAARAASTGT